MLNTFYIWSAISTAFFLPLSTTITNILFWICPILFLTGKWQERFLLIGTTRALLFIVVLFMWIVIGVTYTTVPIQEALAGLSKYDKLLLGIFFAPAFLKEKHRKYALHAFLLAIAITMAVGFCKDLGLFATGKDFGRFLVFKDRIQTSFLMAFSAYFSLILFMHAPRIDQSFVRFTANQQPASGKKFLFACLKDALWLKRFYLLFSLFSVFFLFSIGGRSGYLVFVTLLAWLLWNCWHWKGLVSAIAISMLMILSAYFFSTAFNARFQESIHDVHVYQQGQHNTSLGLRLDFLKNSLSIIKQYPLLGGGTGSFSKLYASLNIPDSLKTSNPHNEYINVLVQWGAVGLLLLFGLFYVQWKDSKMLMPPMYQVARGVLLAIMVGSLANSWLMDTTEGHFYVYFIALAFASVINNKPPNDKKWSHNGG